jgi:hypothetical protein
MMFESSKDNGSFADAMETLKMNKQEVNQAIFDLR